MFKQTLYLFSTQPCERVQNRTVSSERTRTTVVAHAKEGGGWSEPKNRILNLVWSKSTKKGSVHLLLRSRRCPFAELSNVSAGPLLVSVEIAGCLGSLAGSHFPAHGRKSLDGQRLHLQGPREDDDDATAFERESCTGLISTMAMAIEYGMRG